MQQAADQRRFAVVDVAAGDEAQQVLVFVLLQVRQDVAGDQVGLVCHERRALHQQGWPHAANL
ncbi:hypothetical protein D3C85_1938590 [compost metagenome]